MAKVSTLKAPYFSHDYSTRDSREIKLIIEDFGFEGYGLWWAIVEYMHQNILKVGEERLIAGRNYEEKIKLILNDYGLFKVEDGCYVSERIIRNIEEQEEKSKSGANAAKTRWLMSAYKKYYKEIFNVDVVISNKEINKLKDYDKRIENLKEELPDILFKLSKIKFDNGIKTEARSNWLLSDDNLAKIHNGQYGTLQSYKKYKESLKPKVVEEEETDTIPQFNSKVEAMEFIISRTPSLDFISPNYKDLMKQFDITTKELKEYKC